MGIERIVLEHHGNVPVFGRYIVHQLAANIQFTFCDFFEACHHSERCGFSAAGRSNKNDKFLVSNFQIKLLHGYNALPCAFQIALLLLCAFLPSRFFLGYSRIDFLQAFKRYCCHVLNPFLEIDLFRYQFDKVFALSRAVKFQKIYTLRMPQQQLPFMDDQAHIHSNQG